MTGSEVWSLLNGQAISQTIEPLLNAYQAPLGVGTWIGMPFAGPFSGPCEETVQGTKVENWNSSFCCIN